MADTLRADLERTHANSRSAALDGISARSSVARMAANQADIREIVSEVVAETGGSQKAFAIAARAPQSDVSNALAGKQRLEMQWVLDQDDVFLERVINKIRARRGLVTESDARTAKIARIAELMRLLLEVA